MRNIFLGARALASFIVLLLVVVEASAQSESFLSRLQGSWQGEGTTLGMSSRLQIKWEWVLESKFLRLSLRNEMSTRSDQTQIFEGQALYRATGTNKYEAHWFDSRGLTFPIKASVGNDTLVALWTETSEEGRSSYRLIDARTMEVIDSVKQKDGTWREFSKVIMKRIDP